MARRREILSPALAPHPRPFIPQQIAVVSVMLARRRINHGRRVDVGPTDDVDGGPPGGHAEPGVAEWLRARDTLAMMKLRRREVVSSSVRSPTGAL